MGLKELDVLVNRPTLRKNTKEMFVQSFNRQQMEGLDNVLGR